MASQQPNGVSTNEQPGSAQAMRADELENGARQSFAGTDQHPLTLQQASELLADTGEAGHGSTTLDRHLSTIRQLQEDLLLARRDIQVGSLLACSGASIDAPMKKHVPSTGGIGFEAQSFDRRKRPRWRRSSGSGMRCSTHEERRRRRCGPRSL